MSCATGRCRRHHVCSDCLGITVQSKTFDGKTAAEVIGEALDEEFGIPGQRQPDGFLGEASPGDYWLNPHDRIVDGPCLYIRDPGGRDAALRHHNVVEHEDGAITAEGAIVDELETWHLHRGVWRNA